MGTDTGGLPALPVTVSQPQHGVGPGEGDLVIIVYGRDMVFCRVRGVRIMTPQDHKLGFIPFSGPNCDGFTIELPVVPWKAVQEPASERRLS